MTELTSAEVFEQQNGEVTKQYYSRLNSLGPLGQIACCLFRCQKRSSRAKDYGRRSRYKHAAYDVKAWSMGELCKLLERYGRECGFEWGWKQDPYTLFGNEASWVLYVEIPGHRQVSFHSPDRCGCGPDYVGDFDGEHKSKERILAFCSQFDEGNG